ncbi:type II toxin-antitoxin system PemK/MazF family toxin [Candidatus Peregrinibacteria bacterium]|nr:type II toxin-antitoxin system PemK/MazF family toxin [Candidatus Peregrinibacteria bacterium]
MKQKDIYWANLDPAQGRKQQGKRPVVIISGNAMNNNLGIFITCPISTKVKNYAGCVRLKKNKVNNLRQDSEIITFQIRTVSKKRLTKKIGEITDEELRQIFHGLSDTLTY